MDDLEIIKALGCCCNHSCVECFYAKCDSYEACTSSLHRVALDLINRQRAEIEKLSNHILDLTKMIKAKSDELEAANAEIERLKKGWTADIIETNNIKTEAKKELAERLKAASSAPAMCYDSSVEVIRKASIDNILREMEANR